ncbi:MAG: class I poly(R)-hydroxyalkanoic acid synthase [Alphaproteobacteria bacterium]|nr:class I poly(R)-hydroxyalkanoic acid synthase [Alphaproteobacteria bacterium]
MTITDPAKKPKFSASDDKGAANATDTESVHGKWSEIMVSVAERSQKLIQEFLERDRNQTIAGFLPPSDPARLTEAFSEFIERVNQSPEKLLDFQIDFWKDYIKLCRASLDKLSGKTEVIEQVFKPEANDKRFKDDAWREVWFFDFLKQSYLLSSKYAQSMVDKTDGLDPKVVQKLEFYTRQIVDAMSPSNFWMTNPEVLRATYETGGDNLVVGLDHLLKDLERGGGELAITMSNNKFFRFGENIATTPGKIVYQNELMQLIQYSPMTEEVHQVPLLIIPPWINKYYILDLKEKNSYIRYLVLQGYTVFCVSWVNPDSELSHINFDDYMELGILESLKVIGRITGEPKVNTIGYCIGGTLLSCALAYLKALGDKRPRNIPEIASATYLVTLVDFAEPGEIGVFIDENQIMALEARMEKQGFLGAPTLNLTFNLLRANDLIWSFVVNNYLLGRDPFPFDLLTWNSDTTNLPATMQSFYLRNMYMDNNLIKPNALSMKGVPIDIHQISIPSFILGTREDHITPWKAVYSGTQIYQGPVTFILSKSGHIAGVINPPAANKYGYWTNSTCPADPEEWVKTATSHDGSWWPEWINWLKTYSGEMVPALQPGSNGEVIEDAPGSYVKVRAL